jgi:FkbM family methyltransferase
MITGLGNIIDDPRYASLLRSVTVYYLDPVRWKAMQDLLGGFVNQPGDLVFDIGAHVGDRIGALRVLGTRVVALEPQPLCARALRVLYGGDRHVTIVEAACGATPGHVTMHVNSANPTVSTASSEFIQAADGQPGWEGQSWDDTLEVPMTTLDLLIAEHGTPAFTKIDVEGYEDRVLAGLSRPLPALSFEFTTIQRDVALRCLDRLTALGSYGFNVALGETHRLTFDRWVGAEEMAAHILALPHEANSGDIYAIATVPG